MIPAGADPFGLLERAIGYALGNVATIVPDQLSARTPCPHWDLGTLLWHVNETLAALVQCIGADAVCQPPDPVDAFRAHASRIIGAVSRPCQAVVCAAGYPLTTRMIAATGAVEIAVHGWDIAQTTKQAGPIPDGLARDLLWLGPLLADDARYHHLFAAPVKLRKAAGASDQLVALLGRDPMS